MRASLPNSVLRTYTLTLFRRHTCTYDLESHRERSQKSWCTENYMSIIAQFMLKVVYIALPYGLWVTFIRTFKRKDDFRVEKTRI